MKKEVKIILVILGVLIVIIGGGLASFLVLKQDVKNENDVQEVSSDAKKFAEEYNEVSEDNVFVYRDADEIIKILKNGTGVVYLGFPECKW